MPLSHKPTHLLPYTAEENVARTKPVGNKDWQGGPRYVWTSHFGSKVSNKGDRSAKKGGASKGKVAVERPIIVPTWARKYA